jgi:hypothetical protein
MNLRIACFGFLAAVGFGLPSNRCAAANTPAVKFVRLEVFPERLELSDLRDSRRLLVTGVAEDGSKSDLTTNAKFSATGAEASVDADAFVVPRSAGTTELVVSAGGLETRVAVVVRDTAPKPVSFVREVIPEISKVGCNAGTCHGAQKGRAGFKLSLRGYDPLFDYTALVDDHSGRRFNRSLPSQSLMLLKPTQGVPHEGGFLFDEDSRPYALIRQWIAEGCVFDDAKRVSRIEVFPEKPLLNKVEDKQQLVVLAHYPDGTSRDVTREAIFETSNFEVATVGKMGLIQSVRRGEAAALVRYEGQYAAAPITVIGNRDGYEWNNSPEHNFVDAHVNNKLKLVKTLPSELCTDAEFLRRVSLDLTGLPPSADEARTFLADPRASREKREAKIDELLASPAYVEYWTLKWSDLLLNNRKYISEKGVWAFRNWIRNAIATNQPYDDFVADLMTAAGRALESPAANYYRIAREPREVMENMTQVFLGTRFQCNQCHDHPFERWTQRQYYQLSAFFAGVGRKETGAGDELIYTLKSPQPVVHPGTGQAVAAEFPFEHASMPSSDLDQRAQLSEWLTSKANPYFAKSAANRYWSYFTGLGIIEPVDDIRASNPPSNPELLDALTADFVASGFDLKHLTRTIVSSHTYQRSFEPNRWNEDDGINFSHAAPRRLTAEQLYDALMVATGAPRHLPGVPDGFRAAQLPDPQVDVSFLDMFGRAPRESPCECERTSAVSLAQTLNLVNGATVSNSIIHPEGLIARLVKEGAGEKKLVEEVYLSVVSRYPTEDEAQKAAQYLAQVGNTQEAAQDLMWALINSPEFLFNR